MRWMLLIFLLIACSAYSQQNNNQPQKAEQTTASSQRGTEQFPISVKIFPTPKGEAQTAEDAKERKEKSELDRKLVNFNSDLAYYTMILAWVAALQFIALTAQVIFLRLAFKESRRATDIARDAMIAGERAFVFAVQIFSEYYPIPNTTLHSWRLRPQWQNSGDTPTRNMTIYTSGELRDTQLPIGFNFNYPTDNSGTGLLPPKVTLSGGPFPIFPNPAITTQDILEIQEGRKFLYLWGWARYHDVFPNTPQHITRFCWMVTPNGNPMEFVPYSQEREKQLIFQSIHHREGNCADEECK